MGEGGEGGGRAGRGEAGERIVLTSWHGIGVTKCFGVGKKLHLTAEALTFKNPCQLRF